MNDDEITEILENAGLEPYFYSGRGMFGKSCLAVNCDSVGDVMVAIAREVIKCDDIDHDAIMNRLRGAQTDSMGKGIVLYWPHLKWK